MGTHFAAVYDCFLGKITDDMYVELTPRETIRDLQSLLLAAIPNFEFPRKNLYAYTIQTAVMDKIQETDINILDNEEIVSLIDASTVIFSSGDSSLDDEEINNDDQYIVDQSYFEQELTAEEVNILALLMEEQWVQRQVASIENTRMKYSGSDFKFTSQANHLSKLLALLGEVQRQAFHMQRLYKRRRLDENGNIRSNWDVFKSE